MSAHNFTDETDLPQPLPPAFQEVAPGYRLDDPHAAPTLRWGILGAGGIAHTFAATVSAHSSGQIAAVGSRNLDRARAFAHEFNLPHAYGSYEELVASPHVDAIYVATPHIRHRDDALLALRAGKPVLVEKAFTMTAAEAREVFDEAATRNLFVMEAMWSRHLPHYRFIRALIESGAGGQLVAASADHSQWLRHVPRMVRPELGGGALLDLGVYPLHFLHHALGRPTELVAAGLPTGTGVDASEVILARYPAALGVASATMDGINSTAGTLTFANLAVELPEQFYRPTVVHLRTFPDRAEGGTEQLVTTWDARVPGGFQYQAAEVARCVAAGLTESPVVTWADTLDVMEMMDEVGRQLAAAGTFRE
ncbi:Gfo/Idh/MocA family oxidoreductase [Scrofimicrobium sp. R131]|uniref:Gfo/Idh/MocA family oxidoreductase n=1 Tax=Scrofimicrobium appendicitidis TaxID=3079930 RepID=A0AAU7V761_9ACTO